MGLNYTYKNTIGHNGVNKTGLLYDGDYTTISALEDCPFAKTVTITDGLKGVFVPHDYSVLNLKNTVEAGNIITRNI